MAFKKKQIIFYDLDKLDALSYYIAGFQLNQQKYNYQFKVKRHPPKFLKKSSQQKKWQRCFFSVGLFEYRTSTTSFFFVIDRGDHSSNKMNEGYRIPLLKKVRYYFKANYNPEFIDADPDVSRFKQKIIPILPSFPICVPKRRKLLPWFLTAGSAPTVSQRIRLRVDHLLKLPALNHFRQWRQVKPDLDVFFILIYYHQTHHQAQRHFRNQVMYFLEKRRHLKTTIGFVSNTSLPSELASLRQPRFGMMEYLSQLARSKVAIYVRGPHDSISSKFCQLMAMGKPIVGQTIINNREMLYKNHYFDEQFAFDDPKELVDQVDELLHQPEKMKMLSRLNAETFDRCLAPEMVISDLVEALQKRG